MQQVSGEDVLDLNTCFYNLFIKEALSFLSHTLKIH